MSKSVDGNSQRRRASRAAAGVAIAAAVIALGAMGYASPLVTAAQAQYEENSPPIATDDELTTEKNTPGTVNVLDNDTDPDPEETLTVTGTTDPAHGGVECTSAGDCTYTPDEDFVGADSFDYTLSDAHEATDTGTVTVTVTQPPPCAPAACIDNGTVLLAVHPTGQLNVEDGTGSAAGPGDVGLHFIPTGNDATSPGCLCEGWGAADGGTGVTGSANEARGGVQNMTVESFTSTASTAVSIVNIQNTFRVTHDYHPSPATPNLYEVTVTIENISEGALSDIRYRRVMDWDIEPTPFDEFVTINGGTATQLLFDSNNGFATADPLGSRGDIGGFTGNFTDAGPGDHGALFDFGFGALGAGERTSFRIFYGAASDEAGANAAVAASGAEVFSYGQPSTPDGPTLGTPNTFIFAFGGVGGAPIFPPSAPPTAPGPPPPPAAPTPADLTITITAEELPAASSLRRLAVAAGTRMRYLITVTNNGPGVARNVTLTHGAPAGSSFDSVSTDTGSCSGSSTVTCSFGSLAVGQQAHVTSTATLAQAGPATATASVSASEPDPSSANNSASATTDVTAAITGQGEPVFGTRAVPEVVSGFVCVTLPNTTECVDISTLTEIPVGSIIDTTRGRVRLTVATSAGVLETAELYQGVFQLLQSTAARSSQARSQAASVTEFRLSGGDFSKCTAQPAKAKAKKAKKKRKPAALEQGKPRQRVRRLWGDGAGSFRTRGRYSSATVRGTVWLTEDYCNGTLIRVTEGSVTVRDLVKNRTVVVTAGKSYFAEAPARKAAKAKAKPKKRKPAAG